MTMDSAPPDHTADTSSASFRVDATHPWPGLAAYDEAASAYFHGRDDEAQELLRLIRHAPLVALYGKSGLGKSSLLQAGLFPRLRAAHYLPVWIRLDFSEAAPLDVLEQSARRLEAEIAHTAADAPPREANEDVWQYLQRRDTEIWSHDNHLLTPVLVFDQFEELFTAAGARGQRAPRVASVFDALADLLENRIPTHPVTAGTGGRHARLDLATQRYRVVLTFREDFLPDIETWTDKVPSLLRNRLRLLPMSCAQATAATEAAGAAVLEPGVAGRIVDFVANRNIGPAGLNGHEPDVEPALLSLCCDQLNRRRSAGGRIDAGLVARAGPDILASFYRNALAGMPARVATFIETWLIQGDRYRGSYPRDEALASGLLTKDELAELTDRQRLLRIDQQRGVARIELIHDRLVGVVARRRDERARKRAEADASRRLNLIWLALTAVMIGGGLLAWSIDRQRAAAQDAEILRIAEIEAAERARQEEYSALKREVERLRLALAETESAARRNSDAGQMQLQALAETVPDARALREHAAQSTIERPPRVYLHYTDTRQQPLIESTLTHLVEAGYDAPPPERVNAVPNQSELRYFRHDDAEAAQRLGAQLAAWNGGPLAIRFIAGYESVPARQFEVWYARPATDDIARVVMQLDSDVRDERLAAGQLLQSRYRASTPAIEAALDLLSAERIDRLSPNGRINLLYYLSRTAPDAWTPALAASGHQAVARILDRHRTGAAALGPQTRTELDRFNRVLDAVAPRAAAPTR